MEADKKTDDRMTCAAAFVEGGVQEACDDACSICLEDFSHSDPSTVTSCNHEFHLQCILEWCQRSSNCPMCWRLISLKDATSQELLEAVENEKRLTSIGSRNAATVRHPSLEDFDLQQLSMRSNEVELEEHIFQHLAAAAAMRRGNRNFGREGQRSWSSLQGYSPLFVFSAPNAPHNNAVSTSTFPVGGENPSAGVPLRSASIAAVGSSVGSADQQRISSESRSFGSRTSLGSQDVAEPSDLQSLAESLRSRFNAWSMRQKESISRNSRGWKDRLFARSTSMGDVGSEVRREVNAGVTSVTPMIERLDIRENNGSGDASISRNADSRSGRYNHGTHMSESKMSASCASDSASD